MPGNTLMDTTVDTPQDNRPQILKRPSLKLNALTNWLALAIGVAIGFFLTPAILAHLGEERFGMWMLVSSIIGYFGLLRLAVATSVFRYVPLFRGKGDQDQVNAIVSTSMAFFVGVGLLILIVSHLFASPITEFFRGGPELAALIRVIGLAAALECPSRTFDASIRGYEGFVLVNTADVVGSILHALALFGCIYLGYGLVPMGWALAAVALFVLIAKGITFKYCCRDARLDIREISLTALKLVILYGLVIIIESGGHLLTIQSPRLIIGKNISLEAVGFFGVAYLLITYYSRVITTLSRVFMPRFSYLSGQSDDKRILRLFLRGSRYMAIMCGAIVLLIWAVGPSFLGLWMKNEKVSQAFPALVIIAAGALVWLSHRLSMELLYSLEKQKKLAVLSVIEGISVIGLSLALSYKYGMTGVAIGASVPLILVRGIIQTLYVCRLLKIGFWKYYADDFFRSWVIAVVLAVASYWLGVWNITKNWPSLFLTSALIVLIYGSAVYVLALGRAERQHLHGYVLGTFRRIHAGYLSRERGAA